jgi:mono/diheme cytochrome c family protein
MSTPKWNRPLAAAALALPAVLACAQGYSLGTPASEAQIRGWDIDVRADGAGLPAGRGTVAEGRVVYAAKCSACHGANGEGKPADRLVGGIGSLKAASPVKTIGSFWPYAPTVFDYVRRAMPYPQPGSLSNDEVYALTAFLLHLNGVVAADAVMTADTLPRVTMPNRAGFSGDPRPDVVNPPCRKDCK